MIGENVEKTYNVREVAKIFNKTDVWARSVLRSGKLHGTKLSNKKGWVVTAQDIDNYTRKTYGLSIKDYMSIANYEGDIEEEPDEGIEPAIISTNSISVCPYCGHKNFHNRACTVRYNSDGYLVRYRPCEKCHVIRKTYEIYPDEFEKLVKLKRRVESLALDLNKVCEEAR